MVGPSTRDLKSLSLLFHAIYVSILYFSNTADAIVFSPHALESTAPQPTSHSLGTTDRDGAFHLRYWEFVHIYTSGYACISNGQTTNSLTCGSYALGAPPTNGEAYGPAKSISYAGGHASVDATTSAGPTVSPSLTYSEAQGDYATTESELGQNHLCPRYSILTVTEPCSSGLALDSTTVTETWYHTVYSCATTPTSYVSLTVTVTFSATNSIRTATGATGFASPILTASKETAYPSSYMHLAATYLVSSSSPLAIVPTPRPCPSVGYVCAECPDGYFCPPMPTPTAKCACGMGWPCAACNQQCFCPTQLESVDAKVAASLPSASQSALDRGSLLISCSNGNWVAESTHCRYGVSSSPSLAQSVYTRSSTQTGTRTEVGPPQNPSHKAVASTVPGNKDSCGQVGSSGNCPDLWEVKHHPTISRTSGVFWPAFTPENVQWGPRLNSLSTMPPKTQETPSLQAKSHLHSMSISIRQDNQRIKGDSHMPIVRRTNRYRHG